MNGAMIMPWAAIGLLLAAATAGAVFLRRLGLPGAAGWPMLGGALAGLLLGPSIFGRVLPATYEAWFSGGVPQRMARDQLLSRQGADLLAAESAGLGADGLVALKKDQARQLQMAEQLWRDAQWKDQAPLRWTALLIVGLFLLGSRLFALPGGQPRREMITPLSIGLWAATLPGALAYVAMTAWWNYAPAPSALVAAALAIGPWMLTASDQHAADHAEVGGARMLQAAGRIASLLALVTIGWAMWDLRGGAGLMLALPLAALPIGWIAGTIPRGARHGGILAASARSALWRVFDLVLIPALAALLAVKIEIFEHFAFWPIIVVLLLSDDGRWFGAFIGAMLPGGRKAPRTMRLVLGSMTAGPTQLAVSLFAAHTRSIPEDLLLPLLLGSLLIEFTAPLRRELAKRLAETEAELEK